MFKTDSSTAPETAIYLPPAHATSPPGSIISAMPLVSTSSVILEDYKPAVMDHHFTHTDKPSYIIHQNHVKIEHTPNSDYQNQYNEQPQITFLPGSTLSNSITPPSTAGGGNIRANNDLQSSASSTTYPSHHHPPPPQHQNVGTILAENTAMLQNIPITTAAPYCAVAAAPANSSQLANNFYHNQGHHQAVPQQSSVDVTNNAFQYGSHSNSTR